MVERWTSGQGGVRVGVGELVGGVLVDELFVEEPLDGAALGPDVLEGVPGRDEFGVALVVSVGLRDPQLAHIENALSSRL
ncbi:hypothetical protein V3N99_15795 [Dermatophilaceae bacterium Soc4.6]